MGSATRFNYTMMGDTVNLAARCESGAKKFGVYTMCTEDTKRHAEEHGQRDSFPPAQQNHRQGQDQADGGL